MRNLLLMVCLLLCVGCTQRYGAESLHDMGRYLTLQHNVSTPQDVYQRFGQPMDIVQLGDSRQWLYLHAATAIHGATFVPYVGLVAGGNNIELTRAIFTFDRGDRFQKLETAKDLRYQNMWVGIAEVTQATTDAEMHVRDEMKRIGISFNEEAWQDARNVLKLRPVPYEHTAAEQPVATAAVVASTPSTPPQSAPPALLTGMVQLQTQYNGERLRLEPKDKAEPMTKVSAGIRLRILAEREGWVMVETPDERRGWLKREWVQE